MIKAVYYVEDSGPYNMYTIDISAKNDTSESELWRAFEEELEKQEYPLPSSDVVFIKDNDVIAQMLDKNDT